MLNAVIPAGERYGYLTLELPKLVELEDTTCMMEIVLGASEYFVAGPPEYTRIKFSWDNQLPMLPSGSFYARTYNFLINAGQSMNLANYNYYSRNAHKAILAALGWPWQADSGPSITGWTRMGICSIIRQSRMLTTSCYRSIWMITNRNMEPHCCMMEDLL